MTDFRKIEAELIEFFDAAGVDVIRSEGDAFAVVASVGGCPMPRTCAATFVMGVITCPCLAGEEAETVEGQASILSLTALAERLASR